MAARTEQEEIIRQLRQINKQLNPLPSFIRLGLWIFGFMTVFFGIPSFVILLATHEYDSQHGAAAKPFSTVTHKHVAREATKGTLQ